MCKKLQEIIQILNGKEEIETEEMERIKKVIDRVGEKTIKKKMMQLYEKRLEQLNDKKMEEKKKLLNMLSQENDVLLKSYSNKYYVWVELGLQTANEKIGHLINRCYSNSDFSNAVQLLNKYGIDVVTHIMVGLPGESFDDIKETVTFLNKHNIQGLKIHSCYVVNGSSLALQYLNGDYIPITLDEYINSACYILTHISPDIVIHRISGDAPKDFLLAPEWNSHKKWIMNGINKKLNDENLYQGMYYLR